MAIDDEGYPCYCGKCGDPIDLNDSESFIRTEIGIFCADVAACEARKEE